MSIAYFITVLYRDGTLEHRRYPSAETAHTAWLFLHQEAPTFRRRIVSVSEPERVFLSNDTSVVPYPRRMFKL
jgi:hypothetical protein